MIQPSRQFAWDRGRRGDASRPVRHQVDVRPLDQLVPGDIQSVHQVLGDAGPLILRLNGPQDHLQLDELAQALNIVEVDPCLA
jgi:hypothetical protein